MKEIVNVLKTVHSKKVEKTGAQNAFLKKREQIWSDISNGKFPDKYESYNGKTYTGAPRRTAIRCDFLLASKIALGAKYKKDRISDFAQKDLLFYVMRYRLNYPDNKGRKFYCCPKCSEKLLDCLNAGIFHYIDNNKWKIEAAI